MSQSLDKSKPSTSLKNITNIQTRSSSKKNCIVKMKKIDIQETSDCTLKSFKRKANSSDANVLNKKTLLQVVVKPDTPSPVSEHSVENVIKKYEQLQKVISNKYVTVVKRLKLDYVPFCCENLEYCHKKHYKKSAPPKFPSTNQLNLIRNALQQSRYNVFISLVWGLCHKEQFPGDMILTNIVKLLLTLNPESKHNAFLQPIVEQLLCLFDAILKLFPPCWLSLRESYIKFLRNTMEMTVLVPDKKFHVKNTIFEVVLMLLEDNLNEGKNVHKSRGARKNKVPVNSNSFTHFDNEYHNMQHWEKNDNEEQSFLALSQATRLDRLMQVLHFLAKMLEMDMAMWMLRYHKNPSKHIYHCVDQPLIIELFSVSDYTSSSVLVKKVMSLFSQCVEKDLNENYLNVMDRYITLLANVQNLRDIENNPGGIRYPYVGPRTSAFTIELNKIADVNMKTNVNTYMRFIKHLRCPFVRYEYIDIFLKRLNPAPGKMNPQKIVENFRKNRWLECAHDEDRPLNESFSKQKSIVYRQDYLQIILEALRSYCDYFALQEFFQEVVLYSKEANDIAKNDPKPISGGKKNQIDLAEMRKNILKLEKNLDMSVKLRIPRIQIPTVNIFINTELVTQYRNDLKYVSNLYPYISALQNEHDEDFSDMIEFLKDFTPRN